ncbi:energy-coupling factor ABC transporter permease [Chloroflexota bacterium]
MHIPDGFLVVPVIAVTGLASAGGLTVAVRVTGRKLKEKQVPLMGIMAAFIFAAQMLNVPVAGGTSGHVMGAAIAAILVGPWAAVIIMSVVLITQSLIFQDGGLLALGANIFNMGIVAPMVAYYFYRMLETVFSKSHLGRTLAGFGAAWISVVLASLLCALELGVSGLAPFSAVIPAMLSVHAVIGVVEGGVTVAVLRLVMVARADILTQQKV